MRTVYLAAAFAAGAILAGCSKPEPAAGAPAPDAVAIDSVKPMADSAVTAAAPDSMMKDSTLMPDSAMKAMKDSAAVVTPDSTAKP